MIKLERFKSLGLLAAFCLCVVSTASAKTTPEEAARLGQDLTPLGAEKAGNADGTIPAWDGGLTAPPEGLGYVEGGHLPDPFADDKVLFKITAQNMDQHADKLTEAYKELLRKYPDTYFINVYKTRRTAAAPEWIYENTKRNATLIELTDDKLGVLNKGVMGGIPFPIPQSGEEVMFNHLMRWRGEGRVGDYRRGNVYPDGSINRAGGGYAWEKYAWNIKDIDPAKWDEVYYEIAIRYEQPARKKGELLLLRDPLNQSTNPRMAWQYLPGQRRVRRAPTVAYDTPNAGTSGLNNYDDAFVFNGDLSRFDWKIVGKKEMYIPYNCYQSDLVDEKTLLTPNHPGPESIRFELHRAWVVEATLKDGKRHNYSRRTFYFDEDTWIAFAADSYDKRGILWRTTLTTMKNQYYLPAVTQRVEFGIDFTRPDYTSTVVFNGLEKPMVNANIVNDKFYTAENLRRMGKR